MFEFSNKLNGWHGSLTNMFESFFDEEYHTVTMHDDPPVDPALIMKDAQ